MWWVRREPACREGLHLVAGPGNLTLPPRLSTPEGGVLCAARDFTRHQEPVGTATPIGRKPRQNKYGIYPRNPQRRFAPLAVGDLPPAGVRLRDVVVASCGGC